MKGIRQRETGWEIKSTYPGREREGKKKIKDPARQTIALKTFPAWFHSGILSPNGKRDPFHIERTLVESPTSAQPALGSESPG